MPDTVLKFVPATAAPRPRTVPLLHALRRRKRLLLMVVLPGLALLAAGLFYLAGGRYVSTDDAYIRASKLMVSTDVSGIVSLVECTRDNLRDNW